MVGPATAAVVESAHMKAVLVAGRMSRERTATQDGKKGGGDGRMIDALWYHPKTVYTREAGCARWRYMLHC